MRRARCGCGCRWIPRRERTGGRRRSSVLIHLRDLGYPVLGVRVLASYLGRVSVIDGVLDPSEEEAGRVIETLCQDFRVFVELQGVEGSATIVREVSTRDFIATRRCAWSPRGPSSPPETILPRRGRQWWRRSRGAAWRRGCGLRTYRSVPGTTGISSPRRSAGAPWSTSTPVSLHGNLARLLEVDGMPVAEFEELRRRILAQSIAFGICAPRRFWRRVIASGLGESPAHYVEALAGVRLHIDDDEESREALELSPEAGAVVVAAHGVLRRARAGGACRGARGGGSWRRGADGRAAAAGVGGGHVGGLGSAPMGRGLDDPRRRVGVASDLLLSHAEQDLTGLIDALNDFSGRRPYPSPAAHGRRGSDPSRRARGGSGANNPSLRLAVVASFGEAQSPGAVGPLCDLLAREPSELWSDAARALGQIGPVAVGSVGARAVAQPDGPDASRVVASLRYLAEFHGADAVAELCAHEVPEVRAAAGRALATLGPGGSRTTQGRSDGSRDARGCVSRPRRA